MVGHLYDFGVVRGKTGNVAIAATIGAVIVAVVGAGAGAGAIAAAAAGGGAAPGGGAILNHGFPLPPPREQPPQ